MDYYGCPLNYSSPLVEAVEPPDRRGKKELSTGIFLLRLLTVDLVDYLPRAAMFFDDMLMISCCPSEQIN